MARKIIDPEKKAAAAQKRKASVAKAGARRTERQQEERASLASQKKADFEANVAEKLSTPVDFSSAPDSAVKAAKTAGIGGIAREYANPNSLLMQGLTKQIGSAATKRVSLPGVALHDISDELRGRLNYIAPKEDLLGLSSSYTRTADTEDRANRLSIAHAHLDEADKHLLQHQRYNGINPEKALQHLTLAADRINDAANTAVHKPSLKLPRDVGLQPSGGQATAFDTNKLLSNSWAPRGDSEKPVAWNEDGGTSLANIHSKLNGIRKSYIGTLREDPKVGVQKLQDIMESNKDLSAERDYSPTKLSPTSDRVNSDALRALNSQRAGVISTKADAKEAISSAMDEAEMKRRDIANPIRDYSRPDIAWKSHLRALRGDDPLWSVAPKNKDEKEYVSAVSKIRAANEALPKEQQHSPGKMAKLFESIPEELNLKYLKFEKPAPVRDIHGNIIKYEEDKPAATNVAGVEENPKGNFEEVNRGSVIDENVGRPATGTPEGRIGLGAHFATGNESGRK